MDVISICGLMCIVGIIIKIYRKVTTRWCKSQTCLLGKTAIVTGANTGIGYETALDFAKRGARVILACRNEQTAEEARVKIVKATRNNNVVVKIIDMASFKSVRAFAEDVVANEARLDILVNNAGAFGVADKRSQDGYLLIMQINYFSSFLLTNLLLELMKKTGSSRIINVSSLLARYAKLDLKKIDTFSSNIQAYASSKLCNILFTIALAQKLEGTGVIACSLHPGGINTDITRYAKGFIRWLWDIVFNLFLMTCEEGAQTTIYCSVAKGIEKYNGQHFENCQKVLPYKTATVTGLAQQLWELSEQIVQLKPKKFDSC